MQSLLDALEGVFHSSLGGIAVSFINSDTQFAVDGEVICDTDRASGLSRHENFCLPSIGAEDGWTELGIEALFFPTDVDVCNAAGKIGASKSSVVFDNGIGTSKCCLGSSNEKNAGGEKSFHSFKN